MSSNRKNKFAESPEYLAALKAEEELQARYKDDASPLIQKLLAARREFLETNGRFMTEDEVAAEIKERRGGSYRDSD